MREGIEEREARRHEARRHEARRSRNAKVAKREGRETLGTRPRSVSVSYFALRAFVSFRDFVIQNPDVTPPHETPDAAASGTDAPPGAGLRAAERAHVRIDRQSERTYFADTKRRRVQALLEASGD